MGHNLCMTFTLADMAMGWGEISMRLGCAVLAGMALGWDRERLHKPAGLRTFILVALGSALMAIIAAEFWAQGAAGQGDDSVRLDPLRILQGVIGGIGFLGAGTIIQAGGRVQGLTSAAGLWLVAALGMAFGLGFYRLGLLAGVAGFVTLALLHRIEHHIQDSPPPEGP